MKLTKVLSAVGVFAACSSAIGAETTRQKHFGPIDFGGGVKTEYNSNVDSSESDKSGSFILRFNPYVSYDYKGGEMDLKLSYNPEYRWYEHRKNGQDEEWDHHLSMDYSYRITPSLTLNVYDKYSIINNSTDTEDILGTTTVAGKDNAHTKNVFGSNVEWAFSDGQLLTLGYENRYLDYRDSTNAYREVKTDEVRLAYDRDVSKTITLGAEYVYRFDNFFNSDGITATPGVTRDTSLNRVAATMTYNISGASNLVIALGGDYREVADTVDTEVDGEEWFPYASVTLDWALPRGYDMALAYTYQTVASSKQYIYFAEQQRVSATLLKKFSEKLSMNAFASYEINSFDSTYSLDGASTWDDTEEWIRCGINFTYTFRQNLDFLFGYSRDHLYNAAFSGERYEVNRYDVGVLYKF